MFIAGLVGAGDSKFAAALGLWVGMKDLPLFLVVMAVSGGVFSLLTILARRFMKDNLPEHGWLKRLKAGESVMPYGIPIAFGGGVVILSQIVY